MKQITKIVISTIFILLVVINFIYFVIPSPSLEEQDARSNVNKVMEENAQRTNQNNRILESYFEINKLLTLLSAISLILSVILIWEK